MPSWGESTYGNPCHECGFDWYIDARDAQALVADMPRRYTEALAAVDGSVRHPELAWSVGAYVCHVADNLRIFAERLAGITRGAGPEVAAFDENQLAGARHYDAIPVEAALWSLERAAADWQGVVEQAFDRDVVMVHSERGEQAVLDVVRSNAHDAAHHLWDVQRSLQHH